MIKRYVKRPVEIEAVQWTGENLDEIWGFVGTSATYFAVNSGLPDLCIKTLEGILQASIGDYIIKGVHGEFYPCKPDIFKETYCEVKNDA